MTSFDTMSRSLVGEDCLSVIREFASSGVIPESPLRSMAQQYLVEHGAGFGELEARLTLAVLADTIGALDSRIKGP